MNALVCKLRCATVEQAETYETPKLQAVMNDANENLSFALWTPVADFTLQISNPEARGFFQPGRQYLVTITEASAS